jgi:non-ribosomal peptide synthetase component F
MEDAPATERGAHQTIAPIDVLFARQAAATPEAVAAIDDDTRVTYRELQALADRWARRLEMAGVRAGDAVGVSVGRSPASIAIMLGIMESGGICVPVDRKLPPARRRAMLADSHANVIVATENDDPAVGTDGAITVVTAPADASVSASADGRSVRRESQLTDTWCLLYTSGVTGKPKGVRVTHRQVVSYLAWMWETHPFRPDDVSLLHTSPMLIASAWDCFGPLLQGIPSVVLSERDATNPSAILRRSIECGVTHLSASPGLWQAILDQPSRDLTRWRTLRVGFSRGDQLRVSTERGVPHFPAARSSMRTDRPNAGGRRPTIRASSRRTPP